MKTYRHPFEVHFIAAAPVFFGWMAYRMTGAKLVNAGEVERISFVVICVMLSLLSAWLYWKSALNRYQVTDAGLLVSKLRSKRLIPWEEIDEMVWGRLRHCVFIKGKGRTLVFTSTDKFDDLPELLREIAQRSQCKLSRNLEGLLKS
jgi:hypothetical protein